MTLSVLQSVYKNDKAEFLEKTFESLAEQTVPADKIILVKDGPIPQDINLVIEKWQQRLPLEIHGYNENKGLAHALNYGLSFVNTDLVARMDSDDFCFPDRFEKQLNFFIQNNNACICGTGLSEFYLDKNGTEIRKYRLYPKKVDKNSKLLYKGTPLGHPTLMIKTSILKEFSYSEKTTMNEDIELWFRLLKAGYEINNLQEPLLNFRITDGTFKRRSITKAINEYKIYSSNLFELFGFNFLQIYPFLRFISRFMPFCISKKMYLSNIRGKLLNEKN